MMTLIVSLLLLCNNACNHVHDFLLYLFYFALVIGKAARARVHCSKEFIGHPPLLVEATSDFRLLLLNARHQLPECVN